MHLINQQPEKSRSSGLTVALMIVLSLLLICPFLLPALSGGGKSEVIAVVNNLRQIELMKAMWASDQGITGSVRVLEQDLAPYGYFSNVVARSVIGERYIIHRLGVGPEAQLKQAYKKLPMGTVIRLRPDTNRHFQIVLPK